MPSGLNDPGGGDKADNQTLHVKELYLAECVQDLANQAKFDASKVHNPMMLVKSGEKVLKAADEAFNNTKESDEERAYILYMKFIYVFEAIKKRLTTKGIKGTITIW